MSLWTTFHTSKTKDKLDGRVRNDATISARITIEQIKKKIALKMHTKIHRGNVKSKCMMYDNIFPINIAVKIN